MAASRRGKRKPGESPFVRETIPLAPDHGWRASPGFQVCVISRGDLRFEFPSGWVSTPGPTSIKVRDKPHPKDDMVLEVSVIRCPPTDWSTLPLAQMLRDGLQSQGHFVSEDQIREIELPGLYVVWAEYQELDREANREAVWRFAQCRPGAGVVLPVGLVGILTFGFWADIYERADTLWNHILQTVVLGDWIEDPSRGPRRN